MNISLQFNNFKELDSFIKAMGYSKLAAQTEEAEKEVKQVNVITKDPEPITKKKTKSKEEPKEEPKEEEKQLSLVDIRNLAKKGFAVDRAAVEEIISSYGAKLSSIPKEKYNEFAERVGEIIEGA